MERAVDHEYLNSLIAYFQQVHDSEPYQFIPLKKLTKTPDRFIMHIKYYIDFVRTKELPDVHFSDDYFKLYIG